MKKNHRRPLSKALFTHLFFLLLILICGVSLAGCGQSSAHNSSKQKNLTSFLIPALKNSLPKTRLLCILNSLIRLLTVLKGTLSHLWRAFFGYGKEKLQTFKTTSSRTLYFSNKQPDKRTETYLADFSGLSK